MQDPRDYTPEHAHGGMSRWAWHDDPRRLCFTAARYKHTAKLLEGKAQVLEVGCADGYFSRIVRQHVGALTAIDSDERSIEEARRGHSDRWPIDFVYGTPEDVRGWYDAVYALDVIEHLSPDEAFLRNMQQLAPVAVIGTPSLESQQYASQLSQLGHVNCYSGAGLRKRLLTFWEHVFMFTIHDETLGTSYSPMAQYLLALCVRAG